VCVTGVSGSGKSTLVNDILLRTLRRVIEGGGAKPGAYKRVAGSSQVDRVVEIDQSPIGRSPRSNPATYVGAFDLIRSLFAKTREAKIRGYGPGRFSFNTRGGRCEECQGQGTRRIEMHFLPDVFVECTACNATRYNRETLEVRYRGLNIADVLALRIEEVELLLRGDSLDRPEGHGALLERRCRGGEPGDVERLWRPLRSRGVRRVRVGRAADGQRQRDGNGRHPEAGAEEHAKSFRSGAGSREWTHPAAG